MQRTHANSLGQAELTLDATEAANPEWAPWLRLLRRARAECAAGWAIDLGVPAGRTPDAPLLHQAVIAVDEARAREWVAELFTAAAAETDEARAFGDPGRYAARALELLESAIALDAARLEGMSAALGADPARVAAVVQLAAMPILMTCRRRAAAELPRSWTNGYCAMCGAWPAFAEVRGLERERRARCGRCAYEWRFDVLRCPFCGEREHAQLASLVIEGDETRRIDTCKTCGGYLKSVATLMAVPDDRVAVRDAETVELDLVAADRGLTRPAERAFPMLLEVVRRDGRERLDDGRTWFLA
ncbi:MAG TPA: formate dehydrogenase accessory protein FdhE [Gemmatimonadaceae bacterium]|nr:formate dehydrogenase accessory protein FdhE [Gemmatimonadaceae bacterium]